MLAGNWKGREKFSEALGITERIGFPASEANISCSHFLAIVENILLFSRHAFSTFE